MKARLRLLGALLLALISVAALYVHAQERAGEAWMRREVPLGAASSLVKWCGMTSDRVVVFTAQGMALVDLTDGHAREVIRSPVYPWAVTCSRDGRYLFWTSVQHTDLRMVDLGSFEETIVHRTPEGPRRRFAAPSGSITAKVSPGLNFIVGYRGAPSTIPSPSGKAMKVIEFDDVDAALIAQRGVWSHDERYLFWPDINQKEIKIYDTQIRRLGRKRHLSSL